VTGAAGVGSGVAAGVGSGVAAGVGSGVAAGVGSGVGVGSGTCARAALAARAPTRMAPARSDESLIELGRKYSEM
jgi:hypothetical protein